MSGEPILILQLRRLGDLILTFPLILDLLRRYPANPVWLVAHPFFFEPLMPFAPGVVFFPPEHLPALSRQEYHAIINLGEGAEAASCCGAAKTEFRLGAASGGGGLRIHGYWQLYRTALTCNNRHNLFHWADLNRLDFGIPLARIRPQTVSSPQRGRVGLFVGASQQGKHPDADFWSVLGRRLSRSGYKPILLGGPAEASLGATIAARANLPNFCGKTDLRQLAALLGSVELLVTPDTGPMHLADWLGSKILNLSLGNVQPWETGPVAPGHWVAQARISCAGCWQCGRSSQMCRPMFNPRVIADLAQAIMSGREMEATPGLRVFRTGRDNLGLYTLEGKPDNSTARLLDIFWKQAFLYFKEPAMAGALQEAASALAEKNPALVANMRASMAQMAQSVAKSRIAGLPSGFLRNQPRHSGIFAGFIEMGLQNDNFSPQATAQSLERVTAIEEMLARA